MENTKRIALYIPEPFSHNGSSEFGHLKPYFVSLDEKDEIRNLTLDRYFCSKADEKLYPFGDLHFHSQFEYRAEALKTYGWHLRYENVTVEKHLQVSAMAKMLKRIETARESFPVHAETFGQFVTLHCLALGVKLAVTANLNTYGSDRGHIRYKMGDLVQRHIDWLITKAWQAKQPAAA